MGVKKVPAFHGQLVPSFSLSLSLHMVVSSVIESVSDLAEEDISYI